MHELSLAYEVVEIAQREAERHGKTLISEIRLEVGVLSGVDPEAFQFALEMSVRDTILEHAAIITDMIPGTGRCHRCNLEFPMHTRLDACPACNTVPFDIRGGQEFRVASLVTE